MELDRNERERAAKLWQASLFHVLTYRNDLDVELLAKVVEEEGGSAEEVRAMARAVSDLGGWLLGRWLLRDLLEERFGSVAEDVVQRIEAVENAEVLRRLSRRALRIDSPDRLFDPPADDAQ